MHTSALLVVLAALVQVNVDLVYGQEKPAHGFKSVNYAEIVAPTDAVFDAQLQQVLGVWNKTFPGGIDWSIAVKSKDKLGDSLLGTKWRVLYEVSGATPTRIPEGTQEIDAALTAAQLPGISTVPTRQNATRVQTVENEPVAGGASKFGALVEADIVASTDAELNMQLQRILGLWKMAYPDVTDWSISLGSKDKIADSPQELGTSWHVMYQVGGTSLTSLPDNLQQKVNAILAEGSFPGISVPSNNTMDETETHQIPPSHLDVVLQ